jgi:urease accessory protein UreF
MKVCVVKNGVETEIPNVDVETDAEADKAVKKYLQENNLKKKKGCQIQATRGFGKSKNRYTIQVVDKSASAKKGGEKSKKNNRKRSRHTRR